MSRAPAVLVMKDRERLRMLRRAQKDLFWLAREILDYDLLTEDFHEPICKWWVGNDEEPFQFLAAPRDHYKTTLQVADTIRHILRDPDATHLYLHAVDDEAQKFVAEVAEHLLRNKKLRKLLPDVMPHPSNRRWMKTDRLTVRRSRYDRQPTLLGKSSGSEITGVHVTGSIRVDDIIARNTIEDSALPKIKSWYESTIMPVRRPGCLVRASGTRWDMHDLYGEWIDSGDWKTMVRAARETDGKPDYKGKPVLYSAKEIRLREKQMGSANFAAQMMNDPNPEGERVWHAEQCEHYITADEIKGPGRVFILSDPAPAKEGSLRGLGERARKDGSKDYWATAVVKIRARNQKQELVLLDGSASQEWTRSQGLEEIARFMGKYSTGLVYIESYGGIMADYAQDMQQTARRHGLPLTHDMKGGLLKFSGQYQKGAKNARFGALADRARNDEFLIGPNVPQAFLEMFLEQARNWRALPGGRNTNRYDDCADAVSWSTDSALQQYAPAPDYSDPFFDEDFDLPDPEPTRSRYCAI